MTLKQLVDRALAEVQADEAFTRDLYTLIASLPRTPADPDGDDAVARKFVERTIVAAMHGVGFHIHEQTGEICDPRPKPAVVNNTRWTPIGRPARLRGGRR